jgi:hypothetical protein
LKNACIRLSEFLLTQARIIQFACQPSSREM